MPTTLEGVKLDQPPCLVQERENKLVFTEDAGEIKDHPYSESGGDS